MNRSDNQDPLDSLKLHEGYTYVFLPKTAGGGGHIGPSPNSVNNRATPLRYRAHVGMMGSLAVGLDLGRCSQEELDELGVTRDELKEGLIYLGMGCERCIETGYIGRTAIYSILTVNEAVREKIIARVGASVINEVAQNNGMRTLRQDGARKVVNGESTVEEVLRVTAGDAAVESAQAS